MNGDPHIDFLPQRLIDFTLKHSLALFLPLLQRRSASLSEEYVALIGEKREFYRAVRTKLAQVVADGPPRFVSAHFQDGGEELLGDSFHSAEEEAQNP